VKKKKLVMTAMVSVFALVTGIFANSNVLKVKAAKVITDNQTGTYDGFDYELWKDNGNTSMTLNDKGTFSCNWSNINNALFRTGKKFDATKSYQDLGTISVNYDCDYRPSGNSYLCVYGWTKSPLVEYYIVDSWGTWRPPGASPKGQINVDGGTYDVYETTRVNQPSIEGNTTFKQFWSVRTSKRTSGTISVDKHFKEWERFGMRMGKMYEVALTVEGYQSSGSANVKKHELSIGNSSQSKPTSTPTISPTTKPTSSPTNSGSSSSASGEEFSKEYMSKMEKVNDCPSAAYNKRGNVEYSSFVKKTYASKTTGTNRNVNILLPPNYDPNKKYPVCYVLHGIFGNEDSMKDDSNGIRTISANLVSEGKAKEAIYVLPNIFAPSNPSVQQGFTDECFEGYDNFKNDLINDLMPWMEKNYSIATGRENTAVCGFSMGGRTALYIGYTRPDLFGYVGGFSAAPGIFKARDNFAQHKGIMQESEFKVSDPKYTPYVSLITCGTNDSVVGTFPKNYHEVLTKNAQPHVWIEVPGADHDSRAIRCGFYNFASSLFGILDPSAFEGGTSPTTKPTSTPTSAPTAKPTSTPTNTPASTTVGDCSWIDPSKKLVAFAFDDGPVASGTGTSILNSLKKNNTHATFFYIGQNINNQTRNEVKQAFEQGCEVANHTYTHPYLTNLSPNQIQSEVNRTSELLDQITGVKGKYLLRLPYLATNQTVNNSVGCPMITCSVDTGDWNNGNYNSVLSKLKSVKDGDILLMHENYDFTARAVEDAIPYLHSQGFEIVSVSELFKMKGKTPANGVVYDRCTGTNVTTYYKGGQTNPTEKPTTNPTQTPTEKPTQNPSSNGVEAKVNIENDWTSGAVGSITITNKTGKTLDNWTFEFDLNRKLEAVWTANLVSQTGNHYVIKSPDWTASLKNGESYTITFMAGASNGEMTISNCTLK